MKPTQDVYDHLPSATQARLWFLASLAFFIPGVALSASLYPGGFDWVYTVLSSLAAKKYNPLGGPLFAIGFSLSMAMLWPYVSILKKIVVPTHGITKAAFLSLRLGLIAGFLMGLERWLVYDMSDWAIPKTHEILAILTFVGLYFGIIVTSLNLAMRNRNVLLPVALVLLPVFAIAASQLYLYFDQRDLGWVNVEWREMGVPAWLSFAFWQWLAVCFLYLSMGMLSFIAIEQKQPGGITVAAAD